MREGAVWPWPGPGVPARLPIDGVHRPDGDAPRHESRPPERVPTAASTEDLARLGADICPDAAAEAADWFLGPWADLALPVAIRAAALANHALTERDGLTSAELWARDSRPGRGAVRAVGRAPLGLWRITSRAGGLVTVEDRLGLAPGWAPDGPAVLAPGPTPLVLARAVPTTSGWVLVAPLFVSAAPADLSATVEGVLCQARTRHPRATVESALARFGALLSRTIHDFAWSAA